MYKKLLKTLLVVGLVALTFGSLPALAEDDSLSVSANVGVYSQYIWRGYALSDQSIVFQPSVKLGYRGFGLKVWGNFDTNYYDSIARRHTGTDYNETDFTLSYDWSNDIVSLGAGYIYYALDNADTPRGGSDTQEFYVSASAKAYLNPRITFYRDVDAKKGMYVNLGIGHSYDVTNAIALDLSASIGYYDLNDDSYHALHDANISAASTLAITRNLSMTPSFTYTWAVTTDSKAVMRDHRGDSSHFVGGFTCTYTF